MNGAIFHPGNRYLIVVARFADVSIQNLGDGEVSITVVGVDEGIEIIHEERQLWRAVPEK